MTQPQKASRKDIALIIIGGIVCIALLALPVTMVTCIIADVINQQGDTADWGGITTISCGVFVLFTGVGMAGLMGLLALGLGGAPRFPLLGPKWFLLAFDVTGLTYIFGLIITDLIPIFAPGFYGLVLIPVGSAIGVGLLLLLILAKTKSRLLAQNPPGE